MEMPLATVFSGINYIYLDKNKIDDLFNKKIIKTETKKSLDDLKAKKKQEEEELRMKKELEERKAEKYEF